MATTKYILQGGGEHARVVLDSLITSGFEVAGIFDPKYSGELQGVPQLGYYNPEFEPLALAIVAIGNNLVRQSAVTQTRHRFGTVVDKSVIVSSHAQIGEGSMVLQGAIVQAGARIGRHVILNTGCRVDHDCHLGDFVHIAPGAILCGTVLVGDSSLIGAGAVVLPGIKIGKGVVVGAGAVVTRDVPDASVVVGNPAKQIRKS